MNTSTNSVEFSTSRRRSIHGRTECKNASLNVDSAFGGIRSGSCVNANRSEPRGGEIPVRSTLRRSLHAYQTSADNPLFPAQNDTLHVAANHNSELKGRCSSLRRSESISTRRLNTNWEIGMETGRENSKEINTSESYPPNAWQKKKPSLKKRVCPVEKHSSHIFGRTHSHGADFLNECETSTGDRLRTSGRVARQVLLDSTTSLRLFPTNTFAARIAQEGFPTQAVGDAHDKSSVLPVSYGGDGGLGVRGGRRHVPFVATTNKKVDQYWNRWLSNHQISAPKSVSFRTAALYVHGSGHQDTKPSVVLHQGVRILPQSGQINDRAFEAFGPTPMAP